MTNDNFNKLDGFQNGLVTVYCPHSYNISGNIYLVPPHYVEKLDARATDVMKYCVSGGIAQLPKYVVPPKEPGAADNKDGSPNSLPV